MIWMNRRFTYSMLPSVSVMITLTGLCSTAWESLRRDSSAFFRLLMSIPMPARYGLPLRISRTPVK